ncbi:hypothetical protein IBO29_003916 [Salmonella enterica]|nr:hypothetical protein [Salmonella enterica]EGF6457470.1 hypothetical protein [Salmonella enterica]EGH3349333.1 hypothetical protein [Salmonella enterica]EGY8959472.1 hypothetical protein [Salmonella enterica]
MAKYKNGDVLESSNFGLFTIIDWKSYKSVTIQFHNTGYIKEVKSSALTKRAIKDPYARTVYGVGCLGIGGVASINGKHTRAYKTWGTMLQRCYDDKYQSKYPTYKGCTVCERWLCFANFDKDIKHLKGFAEWSDPVNGYSLDKDILIPNNRVYSPDACMFVSNFDNVSDSHKRRK